MQHAATTDKAMENATRSTPVRTPAPPEPHPIAPHARTQPAWSNQAALRLRGALGAFPRLTPLRPSQSPVLQRRTANGTSPAAVPPTVRDVLSSPSQPLGTATRDFMEPRFGHDFSSVRVHDNHEAHRAAAGLGARAFAVGLNITFGEGQHVPRSEAGRRLLAHELTHTIQQSDTRSKPDLSSVDQSTDAAEQQSEVAAETVARGASIKLAPVSTAAGVQCQLLDPDEPSAEAYGLSQATVDKANARLRRREWQEAIDAIVDELTRKGQIDRSLIEGGRIHFEPGQPEEGFTDPQGFRRTPAGGLKSLRTPIRIGPSALNRGVLWLYDIILHEYHHILQLRDPRGLPTTETAFPGQANDPDLIDQQEVETYAEIDILSARLTGEYGHPRDIRENWADLHRHWTSLSHAKRKTVRDLYVRAHTAAEAMLGGPGTLTNYTPGPP